ncbi:hypothetical protein BC936DRAFT_137907 [Jimgerdemannia flammicorona]|uniref:F-box domain-containing protein n=1 Tax=Jimgerdemannia flammicorona TaxID=994334 RepID=A0A433CWF8_9FUNG|nr:hypothetical protein BC936DRAFT_137907 [Jimgerdemannia flammicorona]
MSQTQLQSPPPPPEPRPVTPSLHPSIFPIPLPSELILLILSHLSQETKALILPLVSRPWRDLLYNTPELWHQLTIYNAHAFVHHPNPIRFSRVTLLDARASSCSDDDLAEALTRRALGTHLTDLDLSVCRALSNKSILLLGKHCPRLSRLTMEGCNSFTDISPLSTLPLTALDLAYCESLSSSSVDLLARSSLNNTLTKLDLNGCYHISHSALTTIADRLHTLQFLSIDGQGIGDRPVIYLFSRLRNLQTFSISFANDLTDSTLKHIAPILPRSLTHLRLRKGVLLSSVAFGAFFADLAARDHSFTRLDLSECAQLDDVALASFRFPMLRYLNIEWCWNVTDIGLDRILFASSPGLVALYCSGLNDITLTPLVASAGRTASSGTASGPVTTIATPSPPAADPSLPHLRALKLETCRMVETDTIRRVSVSNPRCFVVDYYGEVVRGGKKVGLLVKEEVWTEGGVRSVVPEEEEVEPEGMEEKEKKAKEKDKHDPFVAAVLALVSAGAGVAVGPARSAGGVAPGAGGAGAGAEAQGATSAYGNATEQTLAPKRRKQRKPKMVVVPREYLGRLAGFFDNL